jgi:sec-independent protein translocase protein TatA
MASHLLFLDFSGGEFLLIGVVFLMFFGSKSIPGIARSLGKAMRQFREAAGDVQREIHESANTNLKDFDLNTPPANKAPTLPPVVTPPTPPQQNEEKPKGEDKSTS